MFTYIAPTEEEMVTVAASDYFGKSAKSMRPHSVVLFRQEWVSNSPATNDR